MELQSVSFIKSSPDLKSCPPARFPEYAFAGRSNVGKSSLLNFLLNVKNLAKDFLHTWQNKAYQSFPDK